MEGGVHRLSYVYTHPVTGCCKVKVRRGLHLRGVSCHAVSATRVVAWVPQVLLPLAVYPRIEIEM